MDLNTKPAFSSMLNEKTLALIKPFHEKYTYNSEIIEGIVKKLKLSPSVEQLNTLGTYIYIARGILRDRKMQEAGYEKVDKDNIAKFANAKQIELLNKSIFGTSKVVCRVKNKDWLIPGKNRTRGWNLVGKLFGSYAKVLN